jgi:hypothetical protein
MCCLSYIPGNSLFRGWFVWVSNVVVLAWSPQFSLSRYWLKGSWFFKLADLSEIIPNNYLTIPVSKTYSDNENFASQKIRALGSFEAWTIFSFRPLNISGLKLQRVVLLSELCNILLIMNEIGLLSSRIMWCLCDFCNQTCYHAIYIYIYHHSRVKSNL